MANAVRLINLGVPEPTANVLAAQIEAQTGDASKLVEVAIVPELASGVARMINDDIAISAPYLVELAMVPEVAVEVAAQIAADRP